MMKKSRRKFSSKFKFQVVLEALKERETLAEIAKKYEVHPNQITTWKREFLDKAEDVFDRKKSVQDETEVESDALYQQIGKLKVENDFLKKSLKKLGL
ncbi:MAG: transposase [Bacteroidota bacterium]